MQRHAEGCGDLWNRQTTYGSDTTTASTTTSGIPCAEDRRIGAAATLTPCDKKKPTINIKAKPNDWVVIPVFADIVRLAITAREECLKK